mgnify:CR=1 FL=1
MLQNSIDFQYEIIRRRTEFDRKKAAERAHILEGLKVALDFIDEVIAIIRSSKTIAESKETLSERFGLDDIQTTAIVQMQLGKLAGLEKQKILDELQEKLDFIKECDFHIYTCSGAKSLIDSLASFKGKVKKTTIDTATKMYEKIKQSTFSYETIIYWQDLMDYLQNHNIEIVNYEEAKNTIYGKLNK